MRAPDPADAADLALLTDAARAAADVARRHLARGVSGWEKPEGQGPVTEADLEIDTMLRSRLTAARPGYGWLSEETEDDAARLDARDLFIVDPIDGTRAFAAGDPGFCHALAVARGGVVTAALVHLPMLDVTYTACAGAGAWRNGSVIRTPPRSGLAGARILASRDQLHPRHWPGGLPELSRHSRASLAWKLCLVAEGAFDAAAGLGRTWHWDSAAGGLVAREAGAQVLDRFGQPLRYNTAEPFSRGILAGPAAVVAGLLDALGDPARDCAAPPG